MAIIDEATSSIGRWWILPAVAVMVIGLGARPGTAQMCIGDCGGDGKVAINEIIECVTIALGSAALPNCSACSSDGHTVVISNLITAVNNALNGCPAPATVTATATGMAAPTNTATDTPIASATPTPTSTSGACLGKADGTTCDAECVTTDTAVTQICVNSTCEPCTAIPNPSPRFVDNGNGTITDRQTCLVWEKKSADNGIHDKDHTFDWSMGTNAPDGGVFAIFLATLNTAPCFAGHCDWRLPSEDGQNPPFTGAKELESILAAPFPCATNPCVPPAFNTNCFSGCTVTNCSCTQANGYWSATTDAANPANARLVGFFNGNLGDPSKTDSFYVRAVRGGPAGPCLGKPDGTTCDAGSDAPQALTCANGACAPCVADPSASPRFVDNGDATITDRQTCLVWEKKSDDGDVHDKDDTYTWSFVPPAPDGSVFREFLATLNTAPCFAGHCDWRLPSEDGRNFPSTGPLELETILMAPCSADVCVLPAFDSGCTPGCAATACSCTEANGYWSSTTESVDQSFVWAIDFAPGHGGALLGANKPFGLSVRAVRGGS